MVERPIIFSTRMVEAIFEGRKTQTRRIIKDQPSEGWHPGTVSMYAPTRVDKNGEEYPGEEIYGAADEDEGRECPYGKPGDRLWVRESHKQLPVPSGVPEIMYFDDPDWDAVHYRKGDKLDLGWRGIPSIHMPRWASRLSLEITEVRVQKLRQIGNEDARAEGCSAGQHAARDFQKLWETIHGDGSWRKNPWVWVLTFKVINQ